MVNEKLVRRFKRVRITLMRSSMFAQLGPLMMLGETKLEAGDVCRIPTACTNGRDEWYNADFIAPLEDKHIGFIVCHETMHKAGRHLTTYKALHKIDPMLTNMACDYWINGKLVEIDSNETLIAMPREKDGTMMGCYDKKYKGWTVKQIFDDLRAQQKQKQQGGQGDGEGGGSGQGFDDHDWAGAESLSPDEKAALEEDIKQAVRQGAMAAKKAGAGNGGDVLGLGELLRHKVDWRSQLKEFVRYSCRRKEVSSWRKPNRRFLYQDIVMPTIIGNSVRELVGAVDTSGSMYYGNRRQLVMSEIKGLCTTLGIEKFHLIYWDGAVEGHEIYNCNDMANAISKTTMRGGGGTNPSCVPEYLKKHGIKPDAVVMLTDGEVFGGWGNWSCPVLWAIANTDKIMAPVGKTIHIED